MEAGELGLTRGACLDASRLELDAVAGLLWISWCVVGRAGFFHVLFFRFFFLLERTRPAASMRPPLASFSSLLLMRPFFAFRAKKPLHTGVRTGCHYLISPSVCVCLMYVCLYFCMDARNISGLY